MKNNTTPPNKLKKLRQLFQPLKMGRCSENVTDETYNHWNLYQHLSKKGLKGLIPIKQSGRPSFMSTEQEKALYAVVRGKTPHEVGFNGRYNWTAKLASAWLVKEFGIVYAESSMLQVLHQIGLSYSRPSYTLPNADKEKQWQFKEELDAEKKLINGDIDHLLFQDESTIRDYQALRSTWFPVGKQKLIKTYGKHFSVKLTGILDDETGAVHVEESIKFDATVFPSFLETVLKHYPTGKIVMVLDNARVHHAKILRPFS